MDDCPRAPKRRTDAPQQSAGGANRTLPTRPRARHGCRATECGRGKQDVCPHAPERGMDAAQKRAGEASPSPTKYDVNALKYWRREMLKKR